MKHKQLSTLLAAGVFFLFSSSASALTLLSSSSSTSSGDTTTTTVTTVETTVEQGKSGDHRLDADKRHDDKAKRVQGEKRKGEGNDTKARRWF